MIAMALALLAAGALPDPAPTDVPLCVSFALEEPALFTHRLVRCARPLPISTVLDGLSHQHERDEVTQRIRTVLWTSVLEVNRKYKSIDTSRWLVEIERHAPADLQEKLLGSLSRQAGGMSALTARARAKADAFGRLCAVAAVARGARDPLAEKLVWEAWQSAPDFEAKWAMKSSNTLMKRLRARLQALRAENRAARPADFALLREANLDWIWEELLAWSAVSDTDAARDATLAMASGMMRSDVPAQYKEQVRAAFLRFANDPDAETRSTALQEWARLAPRKVPVEDRTLAVDLATADPVARDALSPLLATFAGDEPLVRPLLFAALDSRDTDWELAGSIVAATGAACWLPAELLPRLRALSTPEDDDWYWTTNLALELKNEVWPAPAQPEKRTISDGGGSGLAYCPSYVGGPGDQAIDAHLFGLEQADFDLLYAPSKPPSAAGRKRWEEERARLEAQERKEQLAQRDRLIAFYAARPPLPAGYACEGESRPSAHVAQPPKGHAPQLVLSTGRFAQLRGGAAGWVLEAPDGLVVARALPTATPSGERSPGNMPPLPIRTRVEDWYRGPGAYTLSFPDSDGPRRMSSVFFHVEAHDERIDIELDAPTSSVLRQRPALPQVSVTLELKDEGSVVRIVNDSPDVLRPAGASWRAAVEVGRRGNVPPRHRRDLDLKEDLPPGASTEVEVNERGRRTGDLVATVAFVPVTDDLPDDVVWVAHSPAVRRYASQPKPITAQLPESCNPGFPPTLLKAVADGGVIAPRGTRLERLSPRGRVTLLDAAAPLRGSAADSTHLMTWTDDKLLLSMDRGMSFESVGLPEGALIADVVSLGGHATAFARNGRVWRLEGGAWHAMTIEPTRWRVVSAEGRLGAALDQCGRLFVTSNAGGSWQVSAIPMGLWHDLRVADHKIWLAGFTGLVASADAGASWDSWVEEKYCSGLAARGDALAVVCEERLLKRLGEGIIDSGARLPPTPSAHAAFDHDAELYFAYEGALFQIEDGWLLPLLEPDR